MKNKLLILSLAFATVATAGKVDQQSTAVLSAVSSNHSVVVPNSAPNSVVTLDFGLLTGESWDASGDPDNLVVTNCISGGSITGFQWTDVTVETVGASWLSEPTLLTTDSAGGGGITLAVGNGDNAPGVGVYSSGGIVDLTDLALPDIVALGDGIIRLEIFEGFDDVANAIDANITSGTIDFYGIDLVGTPGPACGFAAAPPKPIPSLQWYGLALLALLLVAFGYRRSRA